MLLAASSGPFNVLMVVNGGDGRNWMHRSTSVCVCIWCGHVFAYVRMEWTARYTYQWLLPLLVPHSGFCTPFCIMNGSYCYYCCNTPSITVCRPFHSISFHRILPHSPRLPFETFWVQTERSAYVPCDAQGLEAVQIALEQIDLIQRFSATYADYTVLVLSAQDIIQTHRGGRFGSLIGVEGGHTVSSSLSVLRQMYRLGARYMTLTHRCDDAAVTVTAATSSAPAGTTGTWSTTNDATAIATTATKTVQASTTKGNTGSGHSILHNPMGSVSGPADVLSEYGKKVIREMNRLGMMIDLSHSPDATIRAVLNETRAPVIFSHATVRSVCNASQNIDDDILRAVAQNDGIVMISFNAILLACGRPASIKTVVDHLNHVRQVAGIKHIGMGSGFDGFDVAPSGLEDVSKYPHLLAELLTDPTWSEEDVRMLAGGNMLRVLQAVENTRDNWKLADITPLEALKPPTSNINRHKTTHCTPMPSWQSPYKNQTLN